MRTPLIQHIVFLSFPLWKCHNQSSEAHASLISAAFECIFLSLPRSVDTDSAVSNTTCPPLKMLVQTVLTALKDDGAVQKILLWSASATLKDNAAAFWRRRTYHRARGRHFGPFKKPKETFFCYLNHNRGLCPRCVHSLTCMQMRRPWGGYGVYLRCRHKCGSEILKNELGFFHSFLHTGVCQRVSGSLFEGEAFWVGNTLPVWKKNGCNKFAVWFSKCSVKKIQFVQFYFTYAKTVLISKAETVFLFYAI